jgi:hypothetical protein
MARNVVLHHHLQQTGTPSAQTPTSDPSTTTTEAGTGFPPVHDTRIAISPYIRKELEAHLSAALLVQPSNLQDNLAARKTHIHLQCPRRGAVYFLDELVENAAKALEADVVRLDGQDVDELLETIIETPSPEMNMGHPQILFTNIMRDHLKDGDQRDEINAEEEAEEMEEEEDGSEDAAEFRIPPDMPMRLFRLFAPRPMYPSLHSSSRSSAPKEDTETKVSTYLDLLVSAPMEKRKMLNKRNSRPGESHMPSQTLTDSTRSIVYLRDFRSIVDTPRGQIAHQALLNVIHNRRRLGEKIVLVVSDDLPSDNVTSTSIGTQYYHVIKIPPPLTDADKSVLQVDREARTREINLRSIQSAIRQRSRSPSTEFECPVGIHLDSAATSSIHGLDKEVWELDKVQRVASIAMGNHGRWLTENKPTHAVPITLADIAQAVDDVLKADKERTERKQEHKAARETMDPTEPLRDVKRENPQLSPINTKDCNKHEQKLLGGVIDPGHGHLDLVVN